MTEYEEFIGKVKKIYLLGFTAQTLGWDKEVVFPFIPLIVIISTPQ